VNPPAAPLAAPDEAPAVRTDRLADSVLTLLTLMVVQRAIGFVRGILFCRWLDPADLGRWDMAFGFLELAVPLAMLGIPGAFGRYVAYYQQRHQLRGLLRKTTVCSAVLAAVAVCLLVVCRDGLSFLVFGDTEHSRLVVLVAGGLVVLIAYYYCTTMLTALRRSRVVARFEFLHSLLFAVLGIACTYAWQTGAAGVVSAYALGALAALACAAVALWRMWRALPADLQPLANRELWPKLLPFALWVWGINWLANLFEHADRYLLLHCGGSDPAAAIAQVGNYHSSRVLPLLLVAIAALLGSVITPYLSHDWELGRRQAVARRIELVVKLLGLLLCSMGVGILVVAPWLFSVGLKGKYVAGLSVLPWTIVYCIWFSLSIMMQKYLWCVERVGCAACCWAAGLAVNVVLNLLLLPRFGRLGLVGATAAGNLVTLLLIQALNARFGLRTSFRVWLIVTLPMLFPLGVIPAAGVMAVVVVATAGGQALLDEDERRELWKVAHRYRDRFLPWRRPAHHLQGY